MIENASLLLLKIKFLYTFAIYALQIYYLALLHVVVIDRLYACNDHTSDIFNASRFLIIS